MLRALLFTVALCPPLLAQGSRLDYERSAGLRSRFASLLDQPRVDVHWADDGEHALLMGADATTLIDLETGRSIHTLERDGDVDRAAFVAGRLVTWNADEDFTRAGNEKNPLSESAFAHARRVGDRARSPRSGGTESEIVFVNAGDEEVSTHWIARGGAVRDYARVAPGARERQHSFVDHVWEVRDARGDPLGRFAVTAGPCVVIATEGSLVPAAPDADTAREERSAPTRPFKLQYRDNNVFVQAADVDDWTQVTTDGTDEARYSGPIEWSPNGRYAVLMRRTEGTDRSVHYVESSPRDQLQPKLHSYRYRKPGDELNSERPLLVDAAAGSALLVDDALFPNPWDLARVEWSADSSRFTFIHNQRGHQVYSLLAVDASTGVVSTLIEERPATFVDYRSKTYYRPLVERDQILWMSERSGWNHLYLFDARDGSLLNPVTTGEWVVRGVERVDEERGEVWLRVGGVYPAQDPYHVHFARVNLDGSGFTLLTAGDGTHTVEFSPDGRHLVATYSRVDLPPVRELRRCADGALISELTRADDSRLRAAGWRPPQRFTAKGRDGDTDIWGIIHRPTNFDPEAAYPVIESIYAGPHGAHVPKRFRMHYKQSELAELGFVVVQIDGMGTNERSKAFHDVAWRNLADAGFPDRRLWIEAAAAADPSLDLARVGIYGGSAGGQSSLGALLDHGDFYHVAVSDCGCHDNRVDKMWWNEQWMGWPIGPHYEAQANATRAHALRGELLLVVGEMDENVDPASTMQVVDALIRADKDFDLLVMPGRGHGAAESRYGTRRRRDFFVEHLLGVEPRWQ